MNNVYDMGGMQGYGPVHWEENESTFHEAWEPRLVGLRFGAGPLRVFSSLDASRFATEKMDPKVYVTARYFERWLLNFEQALIEKGYLTADEIEARMAYYREHPDAPVPERTDPEYTRRALVMRQTPEPLDRVPRTPPRFQAGDRVRTKNMHPKGHTRLPRYARGRYGTVTRRLGVQDLPEAKAHDLGPAPEMVYNVRFDGSELWGESAQPRSSVHIDLCESYLDPA